MKFDLHCHTTVSDGELSPIEVVKRAQANGVDVLSITDHDTIAAYQQLASQTELGLKLIPGIEFSTQWKGIGVHILGLNFDLNSPVIAQGVAEQEAARTERSQVICEKLAKLGLEISLQGVQEIAGSAALGRPHFAKYLLKTGVVKDIRQAFDKYLGDGKPGDVKQFWAPLPQIVDWIVGAGGQAVIAHPKKYKMTRSKLIRLIDDFKAAGGQGIEVISGRQSSEQVSMLAKLSVEKELLASCGSDFHQEGFPWRELGALDPLPSECTPVWQSWGL